MKSLIPLFLLLLFVGINTNLLAQEEETTTYYHALEYMKVPADGHADYLKLEAAWKKIHMANIKAGKYVGWEFSEVIFPTVSASDYHYVTRTVFAGAEQLGNSIENWAYPENLENILTKEELEMVEKTAQYRTMVKREVWTIENMIGGPEAANAKIMVMNFFDSPTGKSVSDHLQVEKDIWQPVHQSRIDAGEMQAWGVVTLALPWGSDYPYDSATIDVYNTVAEHLSNNMLNHFEKAHSGKDLNKMMAETTANANLISSEIWKIQDNIFP